MLDKNTKSHELASDCCKGNRDHCIVIPKSIENADDEDVIRYVVTNDLVLVSNDLSMKYDYESTFPVFHPGFIYIGYSENNQRTMTLGGTKKIYKGFKAKVPNWGEYDIRNSVIDITEVYVDIWHFEAGRIYYDGRIEYKDSELTEKLLVKLQENKLRGQVGDENPYLEE